MSKDDVAYAKIDFYEPLFEGDTLYEALSAGSAMLQRHISEVNALNVFPVPDGDTGTNMSLTLQAALDEVGNARGLAAFDFLRRVSHGALMGARGNSGVILSQILRGVARGVDEKARVSVADLVAALKEGADTAYKGVMKPVEGTILTVIRETAEAAQQALDIARDPFDLLDRVLEAARVSLAGTPKLLPVLAEAGVVDAGGQGLVLILEGIRAYAYKEHVALERPVATVADSFESIHAHPAEDAHYNFDVQCIIHGENLDVEALRAAIAAMGDSVLVVGDSHAVKVHVHSDHPGQVLEYAIQQGMVTSIIIENMQAQYEAFIQEAQAREQSSHAAGVLPSDRVVDHLSAQQPPSEISIVAVVSGEGLERVFRSLGADAIVPGGQTMNPSTQDLLKAIEAVPNNQVIVLPNNSNIILTAEQARALSSKQVRVVPTKTIPQGIGALLGFNFQAGLDENYEMMSASMQQVTTLEITRAVRTVQVNGLAVEEGQIIGLLDGDLKVAGDDIVEVIKSLLGLIPIEDYEILTLYCGQDVSLEDGQKVASVLETLYPHLECEVLEGGQAHYFYIISVE